MFAFGHLIGAWILGKIYQKLSRKRLSDHTWFFLLFGALLPDIDFLLDWTLGTSVHRTFTHSVLFLIFVPFFLWCALFFCQKKNKSSLFQERDTLPFAIALGIFSHFLLDMILSHGIPLFWPSLLHFSFHMAELFRVSFFDPATPSFLDSSYATLRGLLKLTIMDMALGTTWIFYLWFKRRVEF